MRPPPHIPDRHHPEPHPLAGKTVTLRSNRIVGGPLGTPNAVRLDGAQFIVEDWQTRVYGGESWMEATGNPAAIHYAVSSALARPPLPNDNRVLYGKIGGIGYMVHESEIVQPEQSDG